MATHAAFLRGINLGGTAGSRTRTLRAAFEAAG